MNKSTVRAILGVLLLLAGGLYYFFREEPAYQPPQAPPVSAESGKVVFSGNSLFEEKDGKRIWDINAEKIEVDQNTKKIYFTNPTIIFYQDKGGKINVTAPQAVMNTESHDVTMTGVVKAVSSEGHTFTAQEIQWLAKQEYFYGTGNVKMTRDDTVIIGDKVETDGKMEKIKVTGNAKVLKGGPQP